MRPRRKTLRLAATLATVTTALALCLACGSARRWNLLVVCLDTVRYDAFWAPEDLGAPDAFSPWAERALRFERVLAPAPWTLPSVASIFTGRYPASHGAGYGADEPGRLMAEMPTPLPPRARTLTTLLEERGYRSAGVVANVFATTRFGFSEAFALERDAEAAVILRKARERLDRLTSLDAPWFLYLHFMDAHASGPHRVDAEGRRKLGELAESVGPRALDAAPRALCSGGSLEGCLRYLVYLREVLALRSAMAEILEDLERRGALERTLVVLYADHGEEFLDHVEQQRERLEALDHRPARRIGLGHGHTLYQELLHVPLLVWHPEREGRSVATPASLVDVTPTLLDWLGIEAAGVAFDGTSLAGPVDAARPRFASGIAYGPPEAVVVRDRWKLIRRRDPDEQVLYHLGRDPEERRPVADPARRDALRTLLERHLDRAGVERAPAPSLSDVELRALQDLGYLEAAPRDAP